MRKPMEFAGFPPGLARLGAYGPYRASIAHVVDGDTVYAFLDIGLNEYPFRPLRVRDLYAPELHEPGGLVARDYVRGLLPAGTPCVVTTYRDTQTFGRYVADVRFLLDGVLVDLAAQVIAAGHATREPRP